MTEAKNLSQDEINQMLSAMQVSEEDEPDTETPSESPSAADAPAEPDDENKPHDQAAPANEPAAIMEAAHDSEESAADAEPDPGQAEEAARTDESADTHNVPETEAQSNNSVDKQDDESLSEKDQLIESDGHASSMVSEQNDDTEIKDPVQTDEPEAEPQGHTTASTSATTATPKTNRKTRRKKSHTAVWITVGICALLLLIPIGIHLSNVKEEMAEKEEAEKLAAEAEAQQRQQALLDAAKSEDDSVAVERDPMKLAFEKQLSEMQILREELLIKDGQIEELKQEYRLKINKVEDEIIQIKNRDRIRTLPEARKNNSIELNLQTIQRRLAYIQGLERPARWLRLGGETLLFQIRKSRLDLMVADAAEGLDLAGLMHENDRIIEAYTPSPEKLAADLSQERTPALDDIWQGVLQREKESILTRMVDNQTPAANPAPSKLDNQQIWNEICNGNFTRKSALSELSPRAAECLAHWKEADLFMNRLSDLSPKAARNLFTWEGSWICLNGFKHLSPDVARHLFGWNGKWISLNGLAALSFETTMYMQNWKGEKLELMGLKPEQMIGDPLAIKHLAQWERQGGKLYVSDRVRELINMVN